MDEMMDGIEKINQKLQDLLLDLQQLPLIYVNSMFKDMVGTNISSNPGMNQFDPYRVLGLDKTASDEQIKKRYHELLRKLHPDTGGPGGEFLLQMVILAYAMIKKERKWQEEDMK